MHLWGMLSAVRIAQTAELAIPLFEPFSFGEKHRQGMPWILIRPNEAMRHFERAEKLLVCGHECVEPRKILFTGGLRVDSTARTGFEVFEYLWILKRKFQFVAIEDLEDDHFMAVEAKLLEAQRNFFGRLEEVGKEQNNTATMDQANGVLKEFRETCAAGGLKIFKFTQD